MSDADDITNRQLITRETGIALGVVVSLLVATWAVARFTATIENRLGAIEREVVRLREELSVAAEDRWRGSQQRAWANRLADLNADLVVPDPADPNLRPIK